VRLDANVLASLRDALMHVVRNAVAHGVETEAERVALGKSPAGQVRLEVLRRGVGWLSYAATTDGHRRGGSQKGRGGSRLVTASEAKSLPADKIIALLGRRTHDVKRRHELSEGNSLDVVRPPRPAERRNEHS